MELSESLNKYLFEFGDINIYFNQIGTTELKQIIKLSLKFISFDISNNNIKNKDYDIIKLLNKKCLRIV